jgi:putative ABC transport system permease protein
MLKIFLKMAFRDLWKNKLYSIIKISGLSIAMFCSFLILQHVLNELSYDRYHKNAERIYRINTEDYTTGDFFAGCSYKVAPILEGEIAAIAKIARVYNYAERLQIKKENAFFTEKSVTIADKEIFDILSIPIIQGNPETVFADPDWVILTEQIAEKIFGAQHPIGRILTVRWNRKLYDLKVAGIMDDFPQNSHFRTDMIINIALLDRIYETVDRSDSIPFYESWSSNVFLTYVLLKDENPASEAETRITQLIAQHIPPDYTHDYFYHLQPLQDIYLHSSHLIADIAKHGSMKNITIFSAISVLILLIASINFIILTIARSMTRAKELGLRKVVGANRFDLIKQIIGESIFISFIALPFAVALLIYILPFFNHLTGMNLANDFYRNWPGLVSLALIPLLVGIISGGYIAIHFSSVHPVDVLANKINTGAGKSYFRKVMIAVQLVVFIVLSVCAVIVYNQLNYIRSGQVLGFDKENLISIPVKEKEFASKYSAFKEEIKSHPGIVKVTRTNSPPPAFSITTTFDSEHNPNESDFARIGWTDVDEDYFETLAIPLINGRLFSKKFSTDFSKSVLLNEAAIAKLGIEEPIGKEIKIFGSKHEIIGIVKDVQARSAYEKIEPLFYTLLPERRSKYIRQIIVRIEPENISETVAFLEKKWQAFSSDTFTFEFAEDVVARLYESELILGKLVRYATLVAIFIACSGLFGLAMFLAETRLKEIGIRKIFGASVPKIFAILTNEIIILVVIANFISWPIAYYGMNRWLQDFSYQVEMNLWIFLVSGVVSLIIALVTVSFHTVKAAFVNPIKTLRHE